MRAWRDFVPRRAAVPPQAFASADASRGLCGRPRHPFAVPTFGAVQRVTKNSYNPRLLCRCGLRSSPEVDRKALWSRPQARTPCKPPAGAFASAPLLGEPYFGVPKRRKMQLCVAAQASSERGGAIGRGVRGTTYSSHRGTLSLLPERVTGAEGASLFSAIEPYCSFPLEIVSALSLGRCPKPYKGRCPLPPQGGSPLDPFLPPCLSAFPDALSDMRPFFIPP